MRAPAFSVIVPVYKVENYLDKCVQSLINQTYPHIEIILVDDGSPDSCPLLCDAYAQKDERIRVIHQKNGGLSDARNAGIDAANGIYIIFVDSDDYISLDTCERLLPFTSLCCDIIVGDGVAEGAVKHLSHRVHDHLRVFSGNNYLKTAYQTGNMPMAAWLYVYRRAFLNDNRLRFKYGILHEDEHFTPRAFLLADRVVDSGVCFYHYVIREGSITMSKDLRKNARDLYDTCMELLQIYKEIDDRQLRKMLTDSLVVKYLNLFQVGRLCQYGNQFTHKRFVMENAQTRKTKAKAWLHCISPRLYWHINNWSKHR